MTISLIKQLIIVVLLLLVNTSGYCQYEDGEDWSKELGISLGVMNCNTDVGGKIADPKAFKSTGGVYGSLIYHQAIGLRIEAALGSVTATDERAVRQVVRNRNLSFTSSISEVSLLGEIHPLAVFNKTDNSHALSPYFLVGIGFFSFNPKAKLNGRWEYLQPLHTEGEGFPETGRLNYKLSQINFPVGGGLQYNVSERLMLRGEAVYRVLNTDYLDDVSTTYIDPALFDKYLPPADAALAKQLADRSATIPEAGIHPPGTVRGSTKKDAYYSINIKLGIRLHGSGGNFYRNNVKRKSGCPVL